MGFFDCLRIELDKRTNSRVSLVSREHLSNEAYFRRRMVVDNEIVLKSDWVGFWFSCSWLDSPTAEDKEELAEKSKVVGDYSLSIVHLCLCKSLMQMIDTGYEQTEYAKLLHSFYLLSKKEINNRKQMPKLPENDAFIQYCQAKSSHKFQEDQVEQYRQTGEKCIFCNSTKVRSYNKQLWKCYSCNRQFRKH